MITSQQVAALKYMIFNAQGSSDLLKRILAHLLDQSEGLTKEVCLTIEPGDIYTSNEVEEAVQTMASLIESAPGCLSLNQIMHTTGSCFVFSFNSFGTNQTVDDPGCTVWLARNYYSGSAKAVSVSVSELASIDLSKPGLYPEQEKSQVAR